MTEAVAGRLLEPVDCPACRRSAGVEIVYGMPGPELLEAARVGQLALGGCVVYEERPQYRCKVCHHEWRDDESRSASPPPGPPGR